MAETARRAFIATLVAVSVVAFALALWKLKTIVGLLFLAFTISAAMRTGVEALQRHRVPRAVAAYWIFERDRLIDYVTALIPRPKRKTVRDTWHLIDLKLGSYVRGQGLLILIVGTILSLAFWAIHEPYWLLLGSFAGIVEVVPVIGPLSAGVLAVAVGATHSWGVAVAAGIVVLVQRQLEDYLIAPRVLGGAVGLSPLLVMTAVISSGILLGPVAGVLAIPG